MCMTAHVHFYHLFSILIKMSGCPAGMEADLSGSEDELIYNDDAYESILSEPSKNFGSDSSAIWEKDRPQKNGFNIFNKTQAMQSYAEEVSLDSDEMRLAIMKGDVDHVRKSLQAGFAVDTRLASGWTSLMYAASYCQDAIVQLLISHQADVNFQKDLFTALMAACCVFSNKEDCSLLCVKYLIDAGAKINAHDQHLMTPLMYAAKNGLSKIVFELCSHSVDLNKQDTRGWTSVCFGAASGYTHVVRVLLDAGADIAITTHDGHLASDLAFEKGFHLLADILEKCDKHEHGLLSTLPDTFENATKTRTSNYVKYDDLELFLHGMQLGNLVPLFQEHQVSFPSFLNMTDNDLQVIGISQIGIRKKLVDAIRDVHTEEWDLSSLSTGASAKLSVLEISAVLANVSKHAQCLESTVKYVKTQLSTRKDDVLASEVSVQKSFLEQVNNTLSSVQQLHNVASSTQQETALLFKDKDLIPADLVENSPVFSSKKYFLFACSFALLGCLSAAAYVVMRKDPSESLNV